MTQIRLGRYEQGAATLEKTSAVPATRPHVALFLAIAHWHLGHLDTSMFHLAVAATDADTTTDPELTRLRDEVSELLGLVPVHRPTMP